MLAIESMMLEPLQQRTREMAATLDGWLGRSSKRRPTNVVTNDLARHAKAKTQEHGQEHKPVAVAKRTKRRRVIARSICKLRDHVHLAKSFSFEGLPVMIVTATLSAWIAVVSETKLQLLHQNAHAPAS